MYRYVAHVVHTMSSIVHVVRIVHIVLDASAAVASASPRPLAGTHALPSLFQTCLIDPNSNWFVDSKYQYIYIPGGRIAWKGGGTDGP